MSGAFFTLTFLSSTDSRRGVLIRRNIEQWILRCHTQGRAPSSPLTGLRLQRPTMLIPNHSLRQAIAAWRVAQPQRNLPALDLSSGDAAAEPAANGVASLLESGLVEPSVAPAYAALAGLTLRRRNSLQRHGIPASVSVLSAYSNDATVAEAACDALATLWSGGAAVDPHVARSSANALLEVLQRHTGNAAAVTAAATALGNLCACGGNEAVAASDVLRSALTALRIVGHLSAPAAAALLLLLSNVTFGGVEAQFLTREGLRCALGAARLHAGNRQVGIAALRLIRNASEYVAGARLHLASLGAVWFCASLLNSWPTSIPVAEAACQAVASLTCPPHTNGNAFDGMAVAASLTAADCLGAGLLDACGFAARLASSSSSFGHSSELVHAAAVALARIVVGCAAAASGEPLLRARLARHANACGTREIIASASQGLPADLQMDAADALSALDILRM